MGTTYKMGIVNRDKTINAILSKKPRNFVKFVETNFISRVWSVCRTAISLAARTTIKQLKTPALNVVQSICYLVSKMFVKRRIFNRDVWSTFRGGNATSVNKDIISPQ